MQTSRFRDQLSDYVENRLSHAERGAMDAHLSESPEARAELADFQSVWSGLNGWAKNPPAEMPLFFRDNVMSAIERTATRRGFWGTDKTAPVSVWERLFPNTGRLAFAAGFGGVVAVAGFLVANSALNPVTDPTRTVSASLPRLGGGLVLPFAGQVAEDDAVDAAPRFVITSGRTLTPDARTACDFTFWLENAPRGSARFTVLENGATFNYAGLSATDAQTLRVPVDAQKPSALAVKVRWTATGTVHERYLFVPVSPAAIAEEGAATSKPSFSLAELPLLDALAQVATQTNTAITLEEVPDAQTLRARVASPGGESVSVALRRALEPLGLRVSRSPAGVLVTAK